MHGGWNCVSAGQKKMLIHQLKVTGLLSFGPVGLDLSMRSLNVLIGPNGSGKSNLLEVLALLQAAPERLAAPMRAAGGIQDWLWKVPSRPGDARNVGQAKIKTVVAEPATSGANDVIHRMTIESNGGRFDLVEESIVRGIFERWKEHGVPPLQVYNLTGEFGELTGNNAIVREGAFAVERIPRHQLKPEESILSQYKFPLGDMPWDESLSSLPNFYRNIRLYRECSFGPASKVRNQPRADERSDYLSEDFSNLPLVLGHRRYLAVKRRLEEEMGRFYEGFVAYHVVPNEGRMQLFLEEEGGRQIPVGRLSDGTLRYFCLLAILLDPEPPPLVAIEEPELGLHPDVIPHLAELLLEASERMQLVVTTHSRMLVDALSGVPESIVVCSKVDGETRMERLNADDLREWLEKYTLGDLWSKGEIGGNRW